MSAVAQSTRGSTKGKPPKERGLHAGQGRQGLLLVAPTLVFLAIIIIYPLLRAIYLSFQKDEGLDPATKLFVSGGSAGLSNYTHWLLQKCGNVDCPPGTIGALFYDALWVTLFFTAVSVIIEVLLGIWFAMIMNRDFKGRGLVRAAILIPWAIPTAVTAKLWYFIFAYDGIANRLLGGVGISPRLWTSDPWSAKFAIIIADVWKTTPFMALLILAGLQLIPGDVYEAAQIDGASKWQTFVRITLPLVKVPLMVAVLFRTLDVLRIYDLPAILTQGAGGTTSLSMLVINQIRQGGFNNASALSTLVFLLIAFTAFLFIRFGGADVIQRPPSSKKKKDQEPAVGNPVAANATSMGA
ncbi:multiple sugar transport system permease protein [Phycicoccus badiiscoriae]|uniref:Multiple sugar transport system permease protein n=1 Tax=Pedococcus badiiscoriae TaxID=642776 RepID=A0A852W9H9_9MICO|nr:sugar ABC transporter permease [Pedococcus badiiscoriae]NYG05539.1 multiple sugar transport system permease protein [Pedococcus badiiscoriae]